MLSFFPRDVLDKIWDLIGSVSEGFPTFFLMYASKAVVKKRKCGWGLKSNLHKKFRMIMLIITVWVRIFMGFSPTCFSY